MLAATRQRARKDTGGLLSTADRTASSS